MAEPNKPTATDLVSDAQKKFLLGDQPALQGYESSEGKDQFIEFILSDDLPPDIKELFFAFTSKETALTKLDKKEIDRIMTYFDIALNDFLMTKPEYKYTWWENFVFSQLRAKVRIKLNRSLDGFERSIEQTQIQERRISNDARGLMPPLQEKKPWYRKILPI